MEILAFEEVQERGDFLTTDLFQSRSARYSEEYKYACKIVIPYPLMEGHIVSYPVSYNADRIPIYTAVISTPIIKIPKVRFIYVASLIFA